MAQRTHPRADNGTFKESPPAESLIGMRFGRWLVVAYAGRPRKGCGAWECVCDCGGRGVVRGDILKGGASRSCGCLMVERARECLVERSTTHGLSYSPTYRTWRRMISSCTNPNYKGYERYGGRGIAVCSRWLEAFENFLADMGERPEEKTIERINNNGHYEPGNCRWATASEQARNRRSNRLLEFDGKTMTLIEWSEKTGLAAHTISRRLEYGWSVAKALTAKPRGCDAKNV